MTNSKNNNKETTKYLKFFKKDNFILSGKYIWSFNLMGNKQTSVHYFFSDSIKYKMTGKIYSTKYTMKKLSFEKKIKNV